MTDPSPISLRPERAEDAQAICDLVARAFAPMPFSDGTEAALVGDLRDAGDLTLSLVAHDAQGTILGHIGFSPVRIAGADCGWFQMAPVSVAPGHQRQGIGSALIRAGIEAMAGQGARGLAVVGNPAFYERFGFAVHPALAPEHEADAPWFRTLPLSGEVPAGLLRYAPAFYPG